MEATTRAVVRATCTGNPSLWILPLGQICSVIGHGQLPALVFSSEPLSLFGSHASFTRCQTNAKRRIIFQSPCRGLLPVVKCSLARHRASGTIRSAGLLVLRRFAPVSYALTLLIEFGRSGEPKIINTSVVTCVARGAST